jgi:pimeloyl-ACP methyl ester carboxylesterase
MTKPLTIVGVHGFICDNVSARNFVAHSLEYASLDNIDIRIYAPDLPGHGKEPFIGIETLDDFARFLRIKIQEQVEGDYVVLGFSMGGMVALKYAELYRDDINMLGIGVWGSPLRSLRESVTPLFKEAARSVVLDIFPDPVFSKLTKNKMLIDFMRRIDVNIEPLERLNVKRIIDILSNPTFDFDSPVNKCFVYGTLDPLVTKKNYDYITGLNCSNCETHLLPNAGHFGTKEGVKKAYNAFGKYIVKLVTDNPVFATEFITK